MMASDVANEVTLLRRHAADLSVELDTTVRDEDVQVRFRSGREKSRFFAALQQAAPPLFGDWWDWPWENPVDWWRGLKVRIPYEDLPQVVEHLRTVAVARAVGAEVATGRRPFNPWPALISAVAVGGPLACLVMAGWNAVRGDSRVAVAFLIGAAVVGFYNFATNPWVFERGSWKRAVGK